MAQTTEDIKLVPDSTGKEVKEQAVESERGSVEVAEAGHANKSPSSTPPVAEAGLHVEKTSPQSSADAQPNGPPPRPSLVPLGSTHTQSSSLTPVAPHPKRFSAVNINKKFLEKNTASGSATTSSSLSTTKVGSTAARPSIQSTSSHSRLVTAKLTASPAVSSSTGGWSRPSSVAPSPGTVTSSPISTSPLPTLITTQPTTTSTPQLPHAAKAILPQPRAHLVQTQPAPKESAAAKPVWGNVKPPIAVPIRPDIQPSDFPTAAEVAHSATSAMLKQTKADEAKSTSDTAAKQLRLEEADAFRGIHLDPNAHHWDEMEEDDDNFLDGVIEFGDGRQYKIESSESHQSGLSASQSGSLAPPQAGESTASGPVTKEERFVDDFDRSWPKSRTSPASVSRDFPPPAAAASQSASPSVSPVISHATHSPQDSSRVLFNERSNRLEPYSQAHRPGPGPFGAKRPGFPDGPHPGEPRNARDGPQNIQVLQKPSGSDFSRSRRFSNSSGNYNAASPNGFVGDRTRDREPSRRDAPPPSPRLSRDQPPHVMDGRDRDFGHDRGRRNPNVMGPPPLPLHATQNQQGGRQLPPHLSQASPNIPTRRLPSRDSRTTLPEPPLSATFSPLPSGRLPPQSPAVSHKSLSLVSPAAAPNAALPSLSAPELDEARKDVMHSAAERAKQRRQQEEEEREAQKERARRKAAELEEKMKAVEAEKGREKQKESEEAVRLLKEKEVISVIEDAVKSVEPVPKSPSPEHKLVESVSQRPSVRASPSISTPQVQPTSERPVAPRRTGTVPPRPVPLSAAPTTPASQTESWRARTATVPPTPRQIQTRPSASTNFVAAGPSAAEQVETIANGSQDDLEVVDFSELAKFAGVQEAASVPPKSPEVQTEASILTRPSRPVAADFFDEPVTMQEEVPASKKADFGAWRRKVSQDANEPPVLPSPKVEVAEETRKPAPTATTSSPSDRISPNKEYPSLLESFTADSSMTSTKEPLSHLDHSQGSQIVHMSPSSNAQRTPRSQTFYKEAAMSALDDTMSRIKGALMHAHEPSKEVVQSPSAEAEVQPTRPTQNAHPLPSQQTPSRSFVNNRWVPPALRPRRFDDHDHDEPREIFLVTVLQPPPSPTLNRIVVKLPSISKSVDPILNKRLLQAFSRPPYQARMDILSFDPPVFDMNRRDWSLNDVLFRKPPPGFKGKFKYRVSLPRNKGPRVNIPNAALAKPYGRQTLADDASTWRKATVSPTIAKAELANGVLSLNTMSRSPPPETMSPQAAVTSIPKTNENSPSKSSDSNQAVRSRSQPKMPEGSAVAFIRDSRIDVVEADTKPLVNFIVGSQLEERNGSPQDGLPDNQLAMFSLDGRGATPTAINGMKSTAIDDHMPIFASIRAESKGSDDSIDPILVTPPTHHSSASWTRSSVSLPLKDSPARAPDPEHLKAVWSQTSNKAGLHAVNSLEGIADDLTALPFTIQDVKSEDGETPPPSLPNAPSRMSLHEVTRAFQQVPTSSAASNQPPHRASFSPPSTQAPVARPPTASYAYSPVSPANMRPAYVPYPSPMMSHSPAPVMYGHPMASSPVPSRMQVNGHTPLYSQPMWMTMPGPSQTHGNMMRPVPSPYPAQMMGYPSPGYVPQPPPNMMPGTPQGQNGSRGRGMPVMSPVVSHAHAHPGQPMYGGSPVMLHAVQVPQNHGYMTMPAGRGQPRMDNGQMAPQQQQHPSHSTLHPQSHSGFNPGSASSFVRSAW